MDGVLSIVLDKDDTINIFNLNGILLYHDIRAYDIYDKLAPGYYIIIK